jgi:ACS family tartrate transporter-like MFS transporter
MTDQEAASVAQQERTVTRKVALRLIPFVCLLYFVAFVDRVNVGFAALTMNQDLGFSASAYGVGAGIFFLGYFLFEVPSNLLLKRVGARRWIARIMVSWGLIAMGMAFVTGPASFWVLRFLLGVAEAGFFPGMILYLTFWFPNSVRGAMIGYFLLASPLSSVIGAPLSTWLLGTHLFGLAGWQTMFLIEGLPAILLGGVVLYWLADSPATATWLNDEERRILLTALARDRQPHQRVSLRDAFTSPRVWLFALIYFGLNFGVYGFGFWAPQMIKALGNFTNAQTGVVTVVPYACGALAMFLWGRHSDRANERIRHLAMPALLSAAGFFSAALTHDVYLAIASFTVAAIGLYAAMPVFWTLPTAMLTGTAAAGGIALINSVGTLSGYVGPVVMGRLKETSGNYAAGLFVLAAFMAAAGAGSWMVGRRATLSVSSPAPLRTHPRAEHE